MPLPNVARRAARIAVLVGSLVTLVVPHFAAAQSADGQGQAEPRSVATASKMAHFMQIKRDGKGRPLAMQTSVTRYEGTNAEGEPVSVDLIGVVHVGEGDYYEALNGIFEQYDGMLYELVAPEGTVVPKGGRGEGDMLNPIAALQKGMQQGLGLEFQLDHIDYTRSNFVHADMSPEEFAESMAANDESVSRILLKAMGQSLAMQGSGGGSEIRMMMALFSSNREIRLRRIMAEQMEQMEAGMAIFEGNEGSTIIDHRNAKAMEVLEREIGSGKRKLAIFYGAGHLPDMERRLLSDFQMKRAGQYWLDAWKLR